MAFLDYLDFVLSRFSTDFCFSCAIFMRGYLCLFSFCSTLFILNCTLHTGRSLRFNMNQSLLWFLKGEAKLEKQLEVFWSKDKNFGFYSSLEGIYMLLCLSIIIEVELCRPLCFCWPGCKNHIFCIFPVPK